MRSSSHITPVLARVGWAAWMGLLRHRWGLGGLAMLVLLVAWQGHWVLADQTWPGADDGSLFLLAACGYHTWYQPIWEGASACLSATPYPPLVPATASQLFRVLGSASLDGAQLSLLSGYGLLLAALWLGGWWESNPLAGLTAAALGALLWAGSGLRGGFFTELAVAGTGMAALVALAASRGLRRGGPSLAAGLFAALGMLSKWTWILFFGPALAWVLIVSIAGRTATRRPWVGASLLLLGCALAAPWYLTHLDALLAFYSANIHDTYAGDPMPLALTGSFYPAVMGQRVSLPLLALALVGAVRWARSGGSLARSPTGLALLSFASGMLLHTILPYRVDRYLIPGFLCLVPAMAWGLRGPVLRAVLLGASLLAVVWVGDPPPGVSPPQPPRAGNNSADMWAVSKDLLRPSLIPAFGGLQREAPPWAAVAQALARDTPRRLLLDTEMELASRDLQVALAEILWPPTVEVVRSRAPDCLSAPPPLLTVGIGQPPPPAPWQRAGTWRGVDGRRWVMWRCP